jgi:predicted TIM-barrel fold metal-dependent hydrolase
MIRMTSFSLALLALVAGVAHGGATTEPTTTTSPGAGVAVYVGNELLRDYAPEPTLVTPQKLVTKPRFPAIDIHCHWTFQQNPQAMLKSMDELGVQRAVNLSGGTGAALERMLRRFTGVAPERLLIFANVDFSRIDEPDFSASAVSALEAAARDGVRGLKIFKSLGLTLKDSKGRRIAIDDPRLDPIWAACGRLKLPVLIHAGDPIAFFQPLDGSNERWMQLKRHPDWHYPPEKFPTYEQVMAEHLRVIERHPQTAFISAHLSNSGHDLAQLARWLDEHPNMYVDISGRVPELGRQPYSARRFLLRYQDRVMFGTDRYPGQRDQPRNAIYYRFLETEDEYFNYYDNPFPTEGEWRIYGMFLPDEPQKKIYHDNAERALAGELPLVTPASAPSKGGSQ